MNFLIILINDISNVLNHFETKFVK